ncbi:MAG TPA: hypothetical protein VIK84_06570 [Haloplasmataceae bacterium]
MKKLRVVLVFVLISICCLLTFSIDANARAQFEFEILDDGGGGGGGSSFVLIKSITEEVMLDTDEKNARYMEIYTLTLYKNTNVYYNVPLEALYTPRSVNYYTTIKFLKSNQTTTSFSVTTSLTSKIESKVGAKANVEGFLQAYSELTASISTSISTELTASVTNISIEEETIVVDGVNNKFGVYGILLNAVMANQYKLKVECVTQKQDFTEGKDGGWGNYYEIDRYSIETNFYAPIELHPSDSLNYIVNNCYFPSFNDYYAYLTSYSIGG